MKIIYVSHERKMGGANLSLFELMTEMKKRGHEVACIVLYHGCPIDKVLRNEGVRTYACLFGWWMRPAHWPGMIKRIFSILHFVQRLSLLYMANRVKRDGFEIVHSNSSCIDFGMQLAKKAGIRHIWHIREYGMADYNLEYQYGFVDSCKMIQDNSDRVVFISRALRDEYICINDKKCLVIHDGLSKKYINKKDNKDSEVIRFVIAGNLTPNKNQDIVIEAADILRGRGIRNFRIIIAGESTDMLVSKRYKQYLSEHIERENLGSNVRLVGYISNMNDLRAQSDVEIVSSVSEAYGRVTVEGMLSRNPVIVSNSGASMELVQDGVTGLVYECGNPASLADRMQQLISDVEACKEMGERAYKYAMEHELLDKSVDELEKVYCEVLQ